MPLELLIAGLLAQGPTVPATPLPLAPGDRVVVAGDDRSIRGRIAEVSADALLLDKDGGRVAMPFATVQQIDRLGDSTINGAAIGAALGGVSAISAMALACGNTNCADTSANIDPRLTLLGALAGAGIGALVDAAIDKRTTVYRSGDVQPPVAQAASTSRAPREVFVRFGWAGLSDDEGSLGTGASVGAGVIVPLGRRFAAQIAYDRHTHRRDFDDAAPPGIAPSRRGFSGTEQLVTSKALIFFRRDRAFRPYAGMGVGFLDSERVSEFPNYISQPGGGIVSAPPDIYRYHTTEFALGFAAGFDARVWKQFSILGDLSLDLSNPSALSSARLTAGGGWNF
jgi:hypothetical protein